MSEARTPETVEPPTFVQIEPVGQCNLRCRMCAIQYRQDGPPYGPPAFMKFDTFVGILDGVPALSTLHLQGLGEPMMHPRFFDMVAYATRRGISVSTNSNLTLLNDARAERCVTSGLAALHVSLDGARAETFERIRVRARFERVLRNLARLRAARRRLAAERPAVRVVMVLMRQNAAELPELVALIHRYGVRSLFVQRLCHDFGESSLPERYRPMREFVDQQMLRTEDAPELEAVYERARSVAGALGVELRLPSIAPKAYPPGTPGRERCDWPWRGLYVSYQGLAMPCCMVSTPDRVELGDVAAEGVDRVWNGVRYGEFRARLDSDEPPEVCRSCSLYAGTF